ncbi:STM3941 family protein [Epilithonimonas zeae]|uniref:STM3941 family protein n=1 Tax=Epilithonimonas zeae TaxID=1416779 RepID=UPI00200C11E8|nr:STM3941 family protein [Epilithonimonas zeae]UQB68063.1 hypothetical protein KI430_13635 [Epilithonimonas zeae]
MNKIEIYSNKKKAFLLLLGSVVFVVLGFFCFLNAENVRSSLFRNPFIVKIAGIASILFFGYGIFVSIKQLIKNKLMLIINEKGINVNPKKDDIIKWEDIDGFSEIKINSVKIINIQINNSIDYINNETNKIRKNLMKFNLNNYGSPFNISSSTMSLNHIELLKLLNENFIEYKFKNQ